MVILLSILLSGGCWNKQEINQIGFAVGLGIDKSQDQYQVTTQMALPGMLADGGGEGPPVWVVSGQGRTIFEAVRDINTRSARKPFWGHLNVIVISEEVAKEGLTEIIDFFSRGRELRRLNQIVIAKGKAREILEAEPKLESINAVFIKNLIGNRNGQSLAPETTLNDLMSSMTTAGRDPIIPKIEAKAKEKHAEQEEDKKGNEPSGGETKEEDKPKEILELRGAGIFKNNKLVDWLNEKETRGYLWIVGQVGSGIIVIDSPRENAKLISLEIQTAKSQIKVSGHEPVIRIEVETELKLVEQQGIVSVERPEIMQEVTDRANEVIGKEIKAALQKAQENNSDIFGIGEKVHSLLPQVWDRVTWSEIFPNIPIDVKVNAKVNVGTMTLQPLTPPSQRAK